MNRLLVVRTCQNKWLLCLLTVGLLDTHVGCEAVTVPMIVSGASATADAITTHEQAEFKRAENKHSHVHDWCVERKMRIGSEDFPELSRKIV